MPLYQLIEEICDAAGLQLIYRSALGRGLSRARPSPAPALAPDSALTEVLQDTGLTFEWVNPRTVTIIEVRNARSQTVTEQTPYGTYSHQSALALSDVMVTGTHLRGTEPVGVDLLRITRAEIERSGHATLPDLLRDLPQQFTGGPGEGTPFGAARHLEGIRNITAASGASLRGLTSGATLVLVNGRRIAPGAGGGRFVDISTIPLKAVERIEILPAGASAIYGSDAVGGVINLILRTGFDGFETSGRVGAAQGDHAHEHELSQLAGSRWASGSGFLSLAYRDRGNLMASDRALSRSSDLRPFGGDNLDRIEGNPGTLFVGGRTYAIPRGQDGRDLTEGDLQAGTVNLHNKNTPLDLLPQQQTLSLAGTLRQNWGDRAQIFVDTILSERRACAVYPAPRMLLAVPSSNPHHIALSAATPEASNLVAYDFIDDFGEAKLRSRTTLADVSAGTTVELTSTWSTTAYVAYSGTREDARMGSQVNGQVLNRALADPDPTTAFNPFGDGSYTSPATLDAIREEQLQRHHLDVGSIDVMTQGELGRLAGAPVLAVLGANYRDQSLTSTIRASVYPDAHQQRGRDVTAAYGELHLPLARERGYVALAARHERHSDFGSATTPRIGLTFSPAKLFSLRSSWSKSFKAPNLTDLDESLNGAYLIPQIDPASPNGTSLALIWSGGSADLTQESATTWTVGGDLNWLEQGFSLGLTYFNTKFYDRVDYPGPRDRVDGFLIDPSFDELVTRDPSAAYREEVCRRSPTSPDPGGCLNAPIAAVVDLRYRNVVETNTSGIDFKARHRIATAAGELQTALWGSFLHGFSEATLPGAVPRELLDTPGYPLRFRARSMLAWARGSIGANAFIHYRGAYRDSLSRKRIDDWTTLDLQLRYETHDTTVSLSLQNVFNAMPGFWNNPLGIGYDLANGDLLGRYGAVELRKRW